MKRFVSNPKRFRVKNHGLDFFIKFYWEGGKEVSNFNIVIFPDYL